jgi:hypothetical protein
MQIAGKIRKKKPRDEKSPECSVGRCPDMITRLRARILQLAAGMICHISALGAADRLPDAVTLDQEYTTTIRPLLETYCFECHGGGRKKGEVQFDLLDHHLTEKNVPVWTTARNVLDVASMPPEEAKKQPTREERERLLKWIAGSIQRFEADHLETQGDVLLRRINLRAYQNMMQTLTGIRPDISEFQQDGTLQHFDTAGSAIYLTQDQLEQFFGCAQHAIADAAASRASTAKGVDMKRVYRDYYQGASRADIPVLEKFLTDHSDAAGFATIRELPKRTDRPQALQEAITRVIDPTICATYGKKKYAEVEKEGIDWQHDEKCMQAVLDRLRASVELYKQRIAGISEFQPLETWHGPGSPAFIFDRVKVETAGTYRISATVRTFKDGCPLPMKFMADGRTVESFLVDAPPESPRSYASSIYLSRGEHQIAITSTLPEGKEGPTELQYYSGFLHTHFGVTNKFSFRNGHIFHDDMSTVSNADLRGFGWRKPEGPLLSLSEFRIQGPDPSVTRPTALAEALADAAAEPTRENAERRVVAFMKCAYAGAGDADGAKPYVDAVMSHFSRNKDFAKALAYGLAGVLSSPRFLYLEESQRADAHRRRPLEGRELARRLAYFLWSDLPDAELLSAAESGALRDDKTLAAQVRRMLADGRSSDFREAFTTQWLRIDHLDSIVVSYDLFPGYDPSVFESARRESVAFFSEVLDHDLSVLSFVDSDFAMLNNRLALLYGIPGITGPEFRRVALPPAAHRGGVLGQASVLIATSNGMTSSLVRRGAFIMEQLLGIPPGVPPPNVPALIKVDTVGADGQPLTQSQRLASHRAIASCARCHDQIDPLGVGLENFDALGAWNDQLQLLVTLKDGKQAWRTHPAEVSGKLPDGTAYDGADALRACLAKQPGRFVRRLAENLMIYALGRDLQQSDAPALDAIVSRTATSGYGLSTLIDAIVLSDQFRDK